VNQGQILEVYFLVDSRRFYFRCLTSSVSPQNRYSDHERLCSYPRKSILAAADKRAALALLLLPVDCDFQAAEDSFIIGQSIDQSGVADLKLPKRFGLAAFDGIGEVVPGGKEIFRINNFPAEHRWGTEIPAECEVPRQSSC
jgi:hypothetical protein